MPHPTGGYKNAAGQKVPGTTTIIGRFKDSGALLHWAFDQGKAAQRGEIESLYDKRDEAANIGTTAHAMVEASIKGWPFEMPSTLNEEGREKVVSAFNAYKAWESMTRLRIVAQEVGMVSEVHQFGGTLDAIGLLGDELCLLDWKTSNGVYPDFLIQLAAYSILWHELNPDKPLRGFHLCRFAKEFGDFSHHYWTDLKDASEQFLLLRRAYDIDKQLKKRAA
jgi:hypothetical protein